jgi:hypothetical protein
MISFLSKTQTGFIVGCTVIATMDAESDQTSHHP